MLSFLAIFGIAYGIAYWVTSTGLSAWRAVAGFLSAFVTTQPNFRQLISI